FDAIVVGAGAAGMMCAAVAGKRGRRVLLIEHYHIVGEKIRISGGGRCNFTNVYASPANYLSENPDFCRSALARYTPARFIALVEQYGIAYHEKTLGQQFCDNSSHDIIAMLQSECALGDVHWAMPCNVERVSVDRNRFVVATSLGNATAPSLVIATGGLTVPKIGATPFGYRIAEQFDIPVIAPRPALVPLALPPEALARYGELAGVSVDVDVACRGGERHFRESLLFTHRGLSGPAILQISSYWQGGEALTIDLLPGVDAIAWLSEHATSSARVDTLLSERLPRRLAQQWCSAHEALRPLRELGAQRLRTLGAALNRWEIVPSGTLGYNKAEVTSGGVDTRHLSSRTMSAERIPGLHFIGEVVDVTGWLGGYNFQWAWASGHAAGSAI
ncbi:MAG TPA: NAD(P)/FAD-dependent oxidoreductase, partial [Casimicrobiaceae bacterium]|nr:NAD(P)/FAD-dependent oxidoreductase [Casimicrobiaceae bacterium]